MRNVLIAIGNSGDAALAEEAAPPRWRRLALVRGMAVWALARLDPARLSHARRPMPGKATTVAGGMARRGIVVNTTPAIVLTTQPVIPTGEASASVEAFQSKEVAMRHREKRALELRARPPIVRRRRAVLPHLGGKAAAIGVGDAVQPLPPGAIASYVDPRADGPVVEIGPGTGPVTEALVRPRRGREPAGPLEYSPEFCALLRRRFPAATAVQGDGYALTRTLAGELPAKAAAIIAACRCSRWKPEALRLDLLRQAFTLMKPRRHLHPVHLCDGLAHAAEGSPSSGGRPRRASGRNVPPARVWIYRQPMKN